MSKIKEWINIVTNLGVIAGLLLVAYQVQQANSALQLETKQWNTEYRNARRTMFGDFTIEVAANEELSSIWRRGSEGTELSEDDAFRFDLLATHYFYLGVDAYRNNNEWDPDGTDNVLRTFVIIMQKYPGQRAVADRVMNERGMDDYRENLDRLRKELGFQ